MSRPSWDDFWFRIAAEYATRATCPRASIGCVIMNPTTKRQVGAGYNGSPAGSAHCVEAGCLTIPGADHCLRAIHAEINAAGQVAPGARNLVAYVVGGRDVCSHCARELYAVGVREIKARQSAPSLDAVLRQVSAWQAATFPHETVAGKIAHLIEELDELKEQPTSGEEMADVVMLLTDTARALGIDLESQIALKLAICRTRTWAAPNADGIIEHVRGGQS